MTSGPVHFLLHQFSTCRGSCQPSDPFQQSEFIVLNWLWGVFKASLCNEERGASALKEMILLNDKTQMAAIKKLLCLPFFAFGSCTCIIEFTWVFRHSYKKAALCRLWIELAGWALWVGVFFSSSLQKPQFIFLFLFARHWVSQHPALAVIELLLMEDHLAVCWHGTENLP